jgi:hypothetical protein
MTTSTEYPTTLTVADAPAECPSWCGGHSARYAADFGPFDDAEAYREGLAAFREHAVDGPDISPSPGLEVLFWVRQPEGEPAALHLEMSCVDIERDTVDHVAAPLSMAMVRELAAAMLASADAVEGVQR